MAKKGVGEFLTACLKTKTILNTKAIYIAHGNYPFEHNILDKIKSNNSFDFKEDFEREIIIHTTYEICGMDIVVIRSFLSA